MREILFRGKRTDNGEWIEGDLYQPHELDPFPHYAGDIYIHESIRGRLYSVIPETVGQYTGKTDINDEKIFDGDICDDEKDTMVQVVWNEKYQWGCKIIKGCTLSMGLIFPLWQWGGIKENGYRTLEVIGNIHDNPELLKGGE